MIYKFIINTELLIQTTHQHVSGVHP